MTVHFQRKIFKNVIGEGGAEDIEPALGDACFDSGVEAGSVLGGIGAGGPLESRGEGSGKVEGDRGGVVLVDLEPSGVARTIDGGGFD